MEELKQRIDKLKEVINIDAKRTKVSSLEEKVADPNLWNDPNNARTLTQELANLKKEIQTFEELSEDISIVIELGEETALRDIEKRLRKLELVSYLDGDYDDKNALFSIHAGQGGTEAMDWANMLFRMYMRFCERRGWDFDVIEMTPGDEAGLKSVGIKITGRYAYGFLKNESGAHRLVRQSPFNADKLRQTSFALVEVMPELEEVDSNIQIKNEDLDWQFVRAGGHGGQNVNKVSTAVRLTHIPSGIVVTSSNERFQEQNRKIALNLLRAKLWLIESERAKDEKKQIKGDYKPASWGTQIRSYVLHPYKMVKDLRTGIETSNAEAVLDGDIEEFIEAEIKIK